MTNLHSFGKDTGLILKKFHRKATLAAAVLSIGCLIFGGSVEAMPYHKVVHSRFAPGLGNCTFPDGSSPTGETEIHCYTPAEFMAAYGIDLLHPSKDRPQQAGLTGQGQTIILADSFGSPTMQADLDHFSDTFDLPRTKIKFIYPDGEFVNPLKNADQLGWAQETTLDLEWAHAVAPGATLVNIVTNVSETTGMTGMADLFKGIEMATAQYPGAIVSMSFGTGEPTFTADEAKTYLQGSFHQILQKATDAGLTLLASAGDSGSTNVNTEQTSLVAYANASYPATDPLITAVGGTALEYGWLWTPQGTADQYWACRLAGTSPCATDFLASVVAPGSLRESVWKEDWAIAAGGGGVSTVFKAPKYQRGLGEAMKATLGGQRGIPDVALNAAVNGGVDVYTSFVAKDLGVNGPEWQSFGGTSCASPETAGLVALAGEKASNDLGYAVSIGNLNPMIYSLEDGDFKDIVPETFGESLPTVIQSNDLYFNPSVLSALGATHVPPVAVHGYPTLSKYDLATGRGSPKAEKFVVDLAHLRSWRAALMGPN